ncbi:hypothetical protein F4813DRAFT_374167 [Daldinia decipiens]|uniref:uncharacterized protein n=1 Tax=Daldinia decipiens TaxID=326647 RepID=UPI0020C548DE|nr:uncharacterized protein F4813DRAFT_374167 [Daldinia decipiens]KAI1653544.1 hypothetical protein F4813DRAFT_374167 [Daldinia decipiens]
MAKTYHISTLLQATSSTIPPKWRDLQIGFSLPQAFRLLKIDYNGHLYAMNLGHFDTLITTKRDGKPEQSVKQGDSMMAFTLITIIFLPLSFLSSLFALDVESFQKAPAWTFGIIFGVSLEFTALTIYALYLNRYVVAIAKSICMYIKKHTKKQHSDIQEQFGRNVENHHGKFHILKDLVIS